MTDIPDGWQLVPIEPTEEMRRAFYAVVNLNRKYWCDAKWQAMLAAAPTPPLSPQKRDGAA